MSAFQTSLFSLALVASTWLNSPLSAQSSSRTSGSLDLAPLTFGNANSADKVDVELTAALRKVDDQTAELQVTMILPKGYYTYSMDKSFGAATKIKLSDLGSLIDSGEDWKADHEPKVVQDELLGQTVEKFSEKVTWSKTLKGTVTAETVVTGKLSGQYCGSGENGVPGECVPINNRKFTAKLTAASASDSTDATAASEVADQNPVSISPKIGYGKSAKAGLMEFEINLTPAKAAVGQEVTLSIKAKVKEPWHTFALDQDPEMAGLPTTLEVEVQGLKALSEEFRPSADPEIKTIDEYVQRVHHGEISWTRKFVVEQPTAVIKGSIRFQLCSNGTCLPPTNAPFELTFTAGKDVSTASPSTTDNSAAEGANLAESGNDNIAKEGLMAFLLTAIGAGFVALLTPCVFPMIPVTVAFFLKQEEKKAGSSLKLAIVYCLSIIGAFTILGLLVAALFGPASLTTLANNRWLNLGFAALFTFFGVMLLGVIDLQIPYWVLSFTSTRESTGGFIGVIFMALTFTLVSFTCTFAFVGSLLVLAAQGSYVWPVIGMLGFSTAFASPFFVLALFPTMLKKLPRSGGWMNDVKVVIGLVEIAAVVKFLSVADIGFSVGRIPVFLTFNIFMWTWIVLATIAGVYLLGIFKKPRPKFSLIRYGSAALFLAFAGRLVAGLYGAHLPADPVWNLVAAFSPPDIQVRQTDDMGYVIEHHNVDFALEFERAVSKASRDQQPLFVDFTGVNCVNCRQMERTVMIEQPVVSAMLKMVRAQLYTDEVPGIRDGEIREKLLLLNRELQAELTGSSALPSYAVVSADGKRVLSYFSGLDSSGGKDFLEFLNAGLNRWESIKAEDNQSANNSQSADAVLTGQFLEAN
jgi:thiol:disulfide interchange protein DsbD